MKLSQLAQKISARLEGRDIEIKGIAGIEEAQESEITFVSNPKYVPLIKTTRAGALIVGENVKVAGKSLLIAKNPYLAFMEALKILRPQKIERKPGISKTAVCNSLLNESVSVGDNCYIGFNVKIGKNSVVMPNVFIGDEVEIGENALIYPNVVIRENVKIGKNVIIHPGVVIGSDGFGYVQDKNRNIKIPQTGSVLIEDDVEIGANTTIDRATLGATVIGEGTKIDNLVQIAHNVRVGKHCIIVAQSGIAGSTSIGDFTTIAGQAGISGHLKLGSHVTVAAQAGVIGDIPDGETFSGYPARPHRAMMKVYAAMMRLPEILKKLEGKWKDSKQ